MSTIGASAAALCSEVSKIRLLSSCLSLQLDLSNAVQKGGKLAQWRDFLTLERSKSSHIVVTGMAGLNALYISGYQSGGFRGKRY